MKKIFAGTLVAVLMLLGTRAQAQFVFGVGYMHTIESTKKTADNSKVGNPEHLNGLYFGASYNIGLAGGLGVAPGLYLDMLFQEENYSASGYSILGIIPAGATASARYRELAVNVPLNLTYQLEFNDNVKLFAYAGPVFQVGLVARSTQRGSVRIGNITFNEGDKYDHYNTENGDMNRFNIYLGGGLGVEIGDIQIMVGYDHNLLDCDRLDGYTTSRNQIKAGINFAFGD